jgi:hypothetical protein
MARDGRHVESGSKLPLKNLDKPHNGFGVRRLGVALLRAVLVRNYL